MISLVLEIWTDGSITPEEGVSIGAKIMQEHLNLFIQLTDSNGRDGDHGGEGRGPERKSS